MVDRPGSACDYASRVPAVGTGSWFSLERVNQYGRTRGLSIIWYPCGFHRPSLDKSGRIYPLPGWLLRSRGRVCAGRQAGVSSTKQAVESKTALNSRAWAQNEMAAATVVTTVLLLCKILILYTEYPSWNAHFVCKYVDVSSRPSALIPGRISLVH